MSVYFSPFVRQMQFGSLHERLHLHARRVRPALGDGDDPSIQSFVSCCSSNVHPFLQDPVFQGHLSGSFSRLHHDSWHGWNAFWGSLSLEVTNVILHHLSLHRTNCTTMHQCWLLTGLVAHNLHTNSSNVICIFGGMFHCTPSCANASLNSAFAFVSARVLPFPANALTVSQPVNSSFQVMLCTHLVQRMLSRLRYQ